MLIKTICCLNRDRSVKQILSNKADVAIYNEWQLGVTFFVTRLNQIIPDSVQSLPDFRRIGEWKVFGGKVDWFTVNRTKEEVLKAFRL